MPQSNYILYYWPLAFRGCFISYLFAYRNVPLTVESSLEENSRLKNLPTNEQGIPYMGPPLLYDKIEKRYISQMPAIVLYVSKKLDLLPKNHFDLAMAMKTLMDCNDVLMEICRYNGSMMWERNDWIHFRGERLPRWMKIFEESIARKYIGKEEISFTDIGIYALFGNMIRCLPELEPDLIKHAPRVHELCKTLLEKESLSTFVTKQEEEYGQVYCGGQIEESIRDMLASDMLFGSSKQ